MVKHDTINTMRKEPQRTRLQKYIDAEYGIAPEHLWAKYPTFAVFRHPNSRKWFGLMMDVARRHLAIAGDGDIDVVNLHVPIDVVATILPDGAFMPGYHMNKASWVTIPLDDRLTDAQIIPLIDASFNSVTPKRKK